MSRRRTPAWLVRATAAAAGLVLVSGVAVVTGGEDPVVPAAQAAPAAPAPSAPPPSPSPSATVAPAPPTEAPAPAPTLDEVTAALGPPPGPQEDRRPARVAAPQDRYAFLAGVTDYRSPTADTIGSANDVALIRTMLLDAGWRAENIRVLTDRQVTGAALREGMAWLAARSRPGTFALFHWSGHVKQLGGTREALWPVDRDWVVDTQVTAALRRAQGRLWVDIAGCEAGSFLPGLPSDRTLVTASSTGTEKSYEYPPWGLSVWTGLLFDLGLRQGAADADGDGRTTVGEAVRYAGYHAQVVTFYQRPHGRQTPQVEGDPVRGWTLDAPPA